MSPFYHKNKNASEYAITTIGVRQGCLLSPDLFSFLLEIIPIEFFYDCANLGIDIDGHNLTDLWFEDGIAWLQSLRRDIIFNKDNSVAQCWNWTSINFEQGGLEWNNHSEKSKTKTMIYSHENHTQVSIIRLFELHP